MNILDDGLLRGKLGSRPVDDEGVAVLTKEIIGRGVLRTYLHNTYSAKKEGAVSTGNAIRSWSSLPSIGITNLYIAPSGQSGAVPFENIVHSVARGLYIVDAMGIHTINHISGDFSIGVTGLWIENGQEQFPVKEAVITGNLLELFGKVEALGDDFHFYGNLGAPSLLIPSADISA
jgi:PmbA protein